jgi:hypothetical protein
MEMSFVTGGFPPPQIGLAQQSLGGLEGYSLNPTFFSWKQDQQANIPHPGKKGEDIGGTPPTPPDLLRKLQSQA